MRYAQRGVVPLIGEGSMYSRTRQETHRFSYFSIVTTCSCMFDDWTNFWPLWKLKKNHAQSSTIFIPEKRLLSRGFWNDSTENFKKFFLGRFDKNRSEKNFKIFVCHVWLRRNRYGKYFHPQKNTASINPKVTIFKHDIFDEKTCVTLQWRFRYAKKCFF